MNIPTLARGSRTERISLNYPSAVRRFPVSNGKAASVTAKLVDGVWGAGVLTVKFWAGSVGPFDFSAAKTIVAGGGAAFISTTDMAGVTEVEVGWSNAAVAGIIDITVTQDVDTALAPNVPVSGSTIPGGGTGGIDSPDGGDSGSDAGGVTGSV